MNTFRTNQSHHELWGLVSVFALLLWILAAAATGQEKPPKAEEQRKAAQLLDELARIRNGRFVLSGGVVDEAGRKLKGVALEVDKRRITGMWENPKHEVETQTVDGTFKLDLEGYHYVKLSFKRDGYHDETMSWFMPFSPDKDRHILEGKEVERPILIKENLRVVLKKIGKLADLVTYIGSLTYTVTGQGKLVDFDRAQPAGDPLRTIVDLRDRKQLPGNAAYLIAEQGKDGNILMAEARVPDGQRVVSLPRKVRLIMNAPGGGFIGYAPADRKNVYRQMKTAPEEGYQKEFALSADTIAQVMGATSTDQRPHFYFKTRDKYGKGHIGFVSVDRERSAVELRVIFRLQPDGSRNLETRD